MASRFDPRPPDRGMSVGKAIKEQSTQGLGGESMDYLQLIGQAEDISRDDFSRRVQREIGNAQRAWRNEHSHGSKYWDKVAFRGRSRLFVPKTRAAIRKNKAGAAAALFATNDVISISSEYDDDPMQLASAAVIGQIMNYRLSRTSHKAGLPWFQAAIGARHAVDVEGICVSKQFWDFHEEIIGEEEQLVENPMTGMYEVQMVPIRDIKRDRPMIELLPYENCYLDPTAPWYDPVQLGAWFIARYPMHLSDVRAMMQQGGKGGSIPWLEVSDEDLRKSMVDDQRSQQRRARERGVDRFEALSMPRDWDIVWINENFIRYNGKEECFWSAGRHVMLSEPVPTEQAYPEQYGMRPYTAGVSEVEPHVLSPMPPVESWQPLQLEINDVVNLRLDATKRSIAPLAKVKRGRGVDFEQVKRRGQPEAMVLLDNPQEDLIFEQTPGPQGQAYQEVAHANTMLDELAGSFSGSSVQTNRQLNETVGGMQMLSGAANSTSEYDLRVWVETWVEPTLRQVMNLIQWYESDEKIVALAGRKAQVYQRHGMNPMIDQLSEAEVTLRVNVGIGAQDPMQMLSKFKTAMDMLIPMGETLAAQGIIPNGETIVEEIMGRAGFKDGHRFFHWDQPPPEQVDPNQAKVDAMREAKGQEIQLKREDAEANRQLKREEMAGNQQMQIAAKIMDAEMQRAGIEIDQEARAAEAAESSAIEREKIGATREVGMAKATPPEVQAMAALAQHVQQMQRNASAPSMSELRMMELASQQSEQQGAIMMALMQQLAAMASQMQQNDQRSERFMEAIAQMIGKFDTALDKMAAPKRVVRDKSGEIIGVDPVTSL
jgi:hypothetical protein